MPDTATVAAALAALVRPGDVLVLAGEMGAGKTTFMKAFAAALGFDGPVTSPTFTLVQHYVGGRLDVHHVDVYRLDRVGELHDLGLGELLDAGGVVCVEWGDVVATALGEDRLEVRLDADPDDPVHARRIELHAVGPAWAQRWAGLCEDLGALTC